MLNLILLLATLPAFAASDTVPPPADPIPPILDAAALKDGRDGRPNVDPCDDFYQFACGAWMDRTVIPADKTSVNRQVTAALDSTDIKLHEILTAYAKGDFRLKSGAAGHVRDYFVSCMDMRSQTAAAEKEVKARVARIRAAADLPATVAELHLHGAGPLFGFGSAQDLDDSTRVIGDAFQGGIALGQRDYYLATDEKGLEILAKYKEHVAKILALGGFPEAEARAGAETVLRFETALAKVSYNMADQYDPSKTHHPMSVAELAKLNPRFGWAAYMKAIGNKFVKRINVDEPEFFQGLDQLLAATPKADLAVYLAWHYLHSVASRIAGDFEKEDFAFWAVFLSGAKEMKPLWKRCTQAVENQLGYALAEAYVKTFDGKAIKTHTEKMITEIKDAFTADLDTLSRGADAWMDAETATKAREKTGTIRQKVGGPVKWRDYSALRTSRGSYLGNAQAVTAFEAKRDIRKIGKPVDLLEWGMMPWEINAYYDRSKNEFNFPFGILQPPSLDLTASNGTNLGSFGGGTIGHELTHGFDNNGAQYDARGNVKNWWSESTLQQFQNRGTCFADQASKYKIELTGLFVNGRNTLEENLADQGGVKLGYAALDQELARRAEAPAWAGRYSERQQFWIGYAQSWCTKITAENLRERMTTDVHPPAEFRVNAVVMNRPEFAKDFACMAGRKMAPVNRCSIW